MRRSIASSGTTPITPTARSRFTFGALLLAARSRGRMLAQGSRRFWLTRARRARYTLHRFRGMKSEPLVYYVWGLFNERTKDISFLLSDLSLIHISEPTRQAE